MKKTIRKFIRITIILCKPFVQLFETIRWTHFKRKNSHLVDYQKPVRTGVDLVQKITAQGLNIGDPTLVSSILERENYYRMKAYFIPFQKEKRFHPGVWFSNSYSLYLFDQKLKIHVFKIIGVFENRIRASLGSVVVQKTGDGYFLLDRNYFKDFSKIEGVINKSSRRLDDGRVEYLKNFKQKYYTSKSYRYKKVPPYWILCETFTFEQLVTILTEIDPEAFLNAKGMSALNKLASEFGFKKFQSLLTNAKLMLEVRNICAHHSRLFNKNLRSPAAIASLMDRNCKPVHDNRLYSFLVMLRVISRKQRYNDGLKDFLLNYVDGSVLLKSQLSSMGFPENWSSDKIWNE